MAVHCLKHTIKPMSFHKTQFLGCYLTIFHTDRCFALRVHCFTHKEWFCFVAISSKDKTVTLRKRVQYKHCIQKKPTFKSPILMIKKQRWYFFCVSEFVILAGGGERNQMCPLNNNEVLESNDILITASNVSARKPWVAAPIHKLTALL